jgi:U1 small nuclear ribonucleoprotein
MKIDGRRVVVDYERGRTQKTWLPRRLGGGKGDTRRTRESRTARDKNGYRSRSRSRDRSHRSYSRDRDSHR